jgi:cytochrome P450
VAGMKQDVWIGNILEGLKGIKFAYVMYYFPIVKKLGSLVINQSQIHKRVELYQWIKAKTETRVATETQRPDFVTSILENSGGDGKKGEGLRKGELESNLGTFLVAGTETTATTLSIGSYLLLEHPSVMERLVREIRTRYESNAEITIDSLVHLEYLNAFIHEVMRCYPPVPAGFLRKVPETGADIAGVHFSGKGNVSPSPSNVQAIDFHLRIPLGLHLSQSVHRQSLRSQLR